MLIISDTKIFKEQYLNITEFRAKEIRKLQFNFLKANHAIQFYDDYMIITPEMIEVKKGKRYILKRKFAKKLYNTF